MGTLAIRTDQDNMGAWPNFKREWRKPTTGIAAQIESSANNIVGSQIAAYTSNLADGAAIAGKIEVGLYDFTVDTGAAGDYNLLTGLSENDLILCHGYFVEVAPTSSGSATIAVNGGTAADFVAATLYSDDIWGKDKELNAFAQANKGVLVTSAGVVKLTIAAAALTAGKIWFFFQRLGNVNGYS